jgi:hypothetical protein
MFLFVPFHRFLIRRYVLFELVSVVRFEIPIVEANAHKHQVRGTKYANRYSSVFADNSPIRKPQEKQYQRYGDYT